MKLFPIVSIAVLLTAGAASAADWTIMSSLDAGKSETKHVSLQKGTNSIDVVPDSDGRVTCQFIDVAAGNVVVLSEKNVQRCTGVSVVYDASKMDVRVTNVNDGYMSYKIFVRNDSKSK